MDGHIDAVIEMALIEEDTFGRPDSPNCNSIDVLYFSHSVCFSVSHTYYSLELEHFVDKM